MKKLLNKTKKGFTLVELLVVIAILAVLASVSVVGYLGFTSKAKDSNAVTELTQIRELMRAELIDGDIHTFGTEEGAASMKYDNGKYYYIDLDTTLTLSENVGIDKTDVFKKHSDLKTLDAKIYVVFNTTATQKDLDGDATSNDYEMKGILYVRNAGGTANWVVSSDAINSGAGSYRVYSAS